MKQYNLIYPNISETLVIYNGDNPKKIALKIFKKLVNKYKDIRICLQDNETKQFIYYVGTTRDKLDIYEKLFNDVYPNQIGGVNFNQNFPQQINSLNINRSSTLSKDNTRMTNQDISQEVSQDISKMMNQNNSSSKMTNQSNSSSKMTNQNNSKIMNQIKSYDDGSQLLNNNPSIQDKNFVKNINTVADNLALSAQEIGKLITEKYSPKEEPSQKLLYLVETGLTKLDNVNTNLNRISNDISNLSNKITDLNKITELNEIKQDNMQKEKDKEKDNDKKTDKNCIIM